MTAITYRFGRKDLMDENKTRPGSLDGAPTTQPAVIGETGKGTGEVSKYWYYEKAVERYLAGKVPHHDLGTVMTDGLLAVGKAAANYNPEKGKFRAYLKSKLHFIVRDYQQAEKKKKAEEKTLYTENHQAPTTTPVDLEESEASGGPPQDSSEFDEWCVRGRVGELLNEFLVRGRKTKDKQASRELYALLDWLFGGPRGEGMRQKELAPQYKVSERQVRTYLSRAANRAAE